MTKSEVKKALDNALIEYNNNMEEYALNCSESEKELNENEVRDLTREEFTWLIQGLSIAREKKYDDERLLEMRREKVKPIIEEFYELIDSLRPGKGSHLYGAITYALNQKKELLVFLDHSEVEMTNNLAERTIKPFVIDRKNFLFSDTEKEARTSAATMAIIETAKRNGLDV